MLPLLPGHPGMSQTMGGFTGAFPPVSYVMNGMNAHWAGWAPIGVVPNGTDSVSTHTGAVPGQAQSSTTAAVTGGGGISAGATGGVSAPTRSVSVQAQFSTTPEVTSGGIWPLDGTIKSENNAGMDNGRGGADVSENVVEATRAGFTEATATTNGGESAGVEAEI
ncbi:hypothetical protein HDU93_008218, partial [Gonapodya sp. JEL0774]